MLRSRETSDAVPVTVRSCKSFLSLLQSTTPCLEHGKHKGNMKIRASKDKKPGLILFFVAVLLAGGTAPMRGQAPCGTFTNTTPIIIPAAGTSGIADPYPSSIMVTGFFGTVTKVTVKLKGLSHTFPDDIDILLVGPGGQNAIIMSDVGGATDITGVTLTLDDLAASSLPDNGPLVTGTFQPTNIPTDDTFPPPAPVPLGGSALSIFNGTSPNGTWSLYVVDGAPLDAGSLAGGWELDITTTNALLANISTRGVVQTGDNVLIGGFIVTGTDPKTVLLRAIGPSLTPLGVPNALADPALELRGPAGFATIINDNWRDSQQAAIIATGIPPTNDLESAILATLAPGAYTAIVRGNNSTTGNALVEAYGL
jgi:subtilisin-like proprotein convertase family protein